MFLTMAYIKGNSLHDTIRAQGPVPPRVAVNLVRNIALQSNMLIRRDHPSRSQTCQYHAHEEPTIRDHGLRTGATH